MNNRELPSQDKATHKEVKYERPSEHMARHCGNCSYVIEASSGTRCRIVKSPIFLTGWCEKWEGAK